MKINPNFHVYRKEREASKAEASREKEERFKQKLEESSILHLYPEKVAEFWDYEKNQGLKPSEVPAGTTMIEIWLRCPIDGFSWKKRPGNITNQSWDRGARGCPCCARKVKKPEKKPALFEAYPELVIKYWNWDKNSPLGLDPETITLSSNRIVWLKCPNDGHEWQAKIGATVNQQWSKGNAGCRVCNGTHNRKLGEWKRRDSLAIEFPDEIKKYWDYQKNNELKIFPDKTTAGSSKKAWFKCPIDGYEWLSQISGIAGSWKEGISGCSRCGKGWTTEAIRQFVASLEKHIPNLTQAERYKIFEQAGIFDSTSSETIKLARDIIKGKLSGQKLRAYIEDKQVKPNELSDRTEENISGNNDLDFLDSDSTLETTNIIENRVEHTESNRDVPK